jgi:hypothetical protein
VDISGPNLRKWRRRHDVTMRYKVYVVLTTDNESGSNAVEVVRP